MKLLFVGSLLVLLSVVAWAAINRAVAMLSPLNRVEPVEPIVRFVTDPRDLQGASRSEAIVWQTSTGLGDCADVVNRRKADPQSRIRDLLSSATVSSASREEETACAPFQLGEVEHGAKVEVLGDCGGMSRVRILSGRLEGRQGCIENDRLSADAAAARPKS